MNTINKRKREFCCVECGLIWFDIMSFEKIITCPECNSNNLYTCDTVDYIYRNIKSELRRKNKQLHYAENHPYYNNKRRMI